MTSPLPLPKDFNPETSLLARTTEAGTFHESRKGAAFAAQLVANGTSQDLELADKVLHAVLGCQERRAGDPHHGNFFWMLEDDVVQDLNAVEFNLEHLIPMLLLHRGRLSSELEARVLEAVRLGLEEIRRLDVLVAYSNITALDILNTCLGGELLQEPGIAGRGYSKLVEWMAFTDLNGAPFEYNSPTYTAVTVRALKRLADLVQHNETRIRARTMAARLGISAALHIHTGTGRWAGPHSRAYHPSVVCETDPEIEMLNGWITDGTLPAWVGDVLVRRPAAFQVVETAMAERDMGLTTFHSASFALGTSSKEFSGQSDVMMLHYSRPGADRPGVLYSRYVTNDKWFGDFYHATDRSKSRNLIDEGQFFGVQDGPRAIGLYTPGNLGNVFSAKLALIWTRRDLIDEIWIGDRKVGALPADVLPGELLVVVSGEVLIAVWPLARTDLGRGAPARLAEAQDDLVLELHNYLGPQKSFWEMGWPGAFFKGRAQCGIYVEVAERSEYSDAQTFARNVLGGSLRDETAPPFTYAGVGQRLWSVEYGRDGKKLGIQVDLMAWELDQRWTQVGDLGWPMLDSPVAAETRSGQLHLGGASLSCGKEAAWLFASPATGLWVAAYHGLTPAPLSLKVPGGRVDVSAMGTGTLVWDNGEVTVEAVDLKGAPRVTRHA
jgi:hypothetical protein